MRYLRSVRANTTSKEGTSLIPDVLMESCWPGDPERDKVLYEAIHTTLGIQSFCTVLAEECSTETDERTGITVNVLRRCDEAGRDAHVALACWESGDHDKLRAAVEDCVLACEQALFELEMYLPRAKGTGCQGDVSYGTIHRMRKARAAISECSGACKTFLEVWFAAAEQE
jgi:hypothetical protein